MELNVSSVGENDARWTSFNDGDASFQLDQLACSGDDARGTHKGSFQGPLGTLLDEGSIRHNVSRWPFQKNGDSRLGELDLGTIGGDHSRGAHKRTLCSWVSDQQVVCELEVAARFGDNSRGSNQENVVGQVMAEEVGAAISSEDSRMADVSLLAHKSSTSLGTVGELEVVGELDV